MTNLSSASAGICWHDVICSFFQDVVTHNNQSSSYTQGNCLFLCRLPSSQLDSCVPELPDTLTKLVPVSKACNPACFQYSHSNFSVDSGIFGSDVVSGSSADSLVSDGGYQCAGWKAAPPATSAGLQPAVTHWSSADYNQPDPSAQTLAYPAAPTLTADVYMQTLCPSYTMLTYTHAPLLTNFGVSRRQLHEWTKVCFKLTEMGLKNRNHP